MDMATKRIISVSPGELVEVRFDAISNTFDLITNEVVLTMPRQKMLHICNGIIDSYDKKTDVYKDKYEKLVFKYADLAMKLGEVLSKER